MLCGVTSDPRCTQSARVSVDELSGEAAAPVEDTRDEYTPATIANAAAARAHPPTRLINRTNVTVERGVSQRSFRENGGHKRRNEVNEGKRSDAPVRPPVQ